MWHFAEAAGFDHFLSGYYKWWVYPSGPMWNLIIPASVWTALMTPGPRQKITPSVNFFSHFCCHQWFIVEVRCTRLWRQVWEAIKVYEGSSAPRVLITALTFFRVIFLDESLKEFLFLRVRKSHFLDFDFFKQIIKKWKCTCGMKLRFLVTAAERFVGAVGFSSMRPGLMEFSFGRPSDASVLTETMRSTKTLHLFQVVAIILDIMGKRKLKT